MKLAHDMLNWPFQMPGMSEGVDKATTRWHVNKFFKSAQEPELLEGDGVLLGY